jgi:hypothetical protein
MNAQHDVEHLQRQATANPLPSAQERFLRQRPSVDCLSVHRAWDLHPGDCFHGRTIASVHGVVGLASSPVVVLVFTGEDSEHVVQTRIGAAHPDLEMGCDDVWRAARAWVRSHGLREGDALGLDQLRAEVLSSMGGGEPVGQRTTVSLKTGTGAANRAPGMP